MSPVDYETPRRDVLRLRRPLGDDQLVFQAQNVRKTNTGVHANIVIALNSGILDEDTFNVERMTDRNRLANAAHKSLNGKGHLITPADLQHELMLFCRGLWDAKLGPASAERRGGSTERTPPNWLLEPYILACAGTILYAPPGRGKSFTALLWTVSVDAGVSMLWPVQQGPALYINLERAPLDDRLGDINMALGLPRERELLFINKRGSSLAAVAELALRTIEREGVVLATLDSLSRAGMGDMNDNDPANTAMDILNSFGCAWLALGHTPREDATHLFGSQMFDAAADVMVRMATEQQENLLGIALNVSKANDVATGQPQQFAYHFDANGLWGVDRAAEGQFYELPSFKSPRDLVRDFLMTEGTSDPTTIAAALDLPRTTVQSLLRKDTNTFVFTGKDGRKSLYGVLSKAM